MNNITVYSKFLNYCIESGLTELVVPHVENNKLSITYRSALEISAITNLLITLPEKNVFVLGSGDKRKVISYSKKNYEERYAYAVVMLLASML